MSKVLVIFLWVAIVLWLLTVSTNLITQPDTMCNLFGGALLVVIFQVSYETRCFTRFLNWKRRNKNENV